MAYEVDVLAVGDGEKGGDAIALRFGNFKNVNEQYVIVIDGGTKESGEKLVAHIKKYYGTTVVDLVVSTHPDGDHASGLEVVLDKLQVLRLWMHRPWLHSTDILHMFHDGRITDQSLRQQLRESLEHAHDLETLAIKKGIPIDEPFTGRGFNVGVGRLEVLGPTKTYYQELLPHFRDCPATKSAYSIFETVRNMSAAVVEAVKTVFESWAIETLAEPDEDTSAENNTSTIMLLTVGTDRILFTADAGVPALTQAADYAQLMGIDLTSVRKVQIPHHGSKRNVSPAILDRILGPRLPSADAAGVDTKSAIASVPVEGSPKHPSKKVLNAFRRRGARWIVTQGSNICWRSSDAPQRPGYGPTDEPGFFSQVEE